MAAMTAERTAQVNARRRERYAANPEKYAKRAAKAYQKDPQKHIARSREYRRRKWAMERLIKAMSHMLNAEQLEQQKASALAEKRERARQRAKLWYSQNKERAAEANTLRREKYPGLHRHYSRSYTMKKKKAQPCWLSDEQIEQMVEIYDKAAAFRKMGLDAHVDHVVPIQSPLVCGLHAPWNLEIIHRVANMAKGNRVWPDMWEPA